MKKDASVESVVYSPAPAATPTDNSGSMIKIALVVMGGLVLMCAIATAAFVYLTLNSGTRERADTTEIEMVGVAPVIEMVGVAPVIAAPPNVSYAPAAVHAGVHTATPVAPPPSYMECASPPIYSMPVAPGMFVSGPTLAQPVQGVPVEYTTDKGSSG